MQFDKHYLFNQGIYLVYIQLKVAQSKAYSPHDLKSRSFKKLPNVVS